MQNTSRVPTLLMRRFVLRFRTPQGTRSRPWPFQVVDLQPAQEPGLQRCLGVRRVWGVGCCSQFLPQAANVCGATLSIKHQNLFLPRHLLGSSQFTATASSLSPSHSSTSSQTTNFKMGFTDLLTDAGLAGTFPRPLRAPPVATLTPLTMTLRSAQQLAPDPFLRRRVCCPPPFLFPRHSSPDCPLLMIPMVRVAERPQDPHLITHPALCAPLNHPLAAVSLRCLCRLDARI